MAESDHDVDAVTNEVVDHLFDRIRVGTSSPELKKLVKDLIGTNPFASGSGGNYTQGPGNYTQSGGGSHTQGSPGDYTQSKRTIDELVNIRDRLVRPGGGGLGGL